MKVHAIGMASALLLVSAAAHVYASDKAAEAPAASSAAESGLRVYVDPQSGELVSQPVTEEQRQQAAATEAAFNQDNSDLVSVRMPDGSVMVDLQGRFQQATVATVQADGSIRTYCADADHAGQGQHSHGVLGTALTPATAPVDSREER